MNFFEHQHKARRRTGLLVIYFLIAVVLTIVAINAAIFIAFKFGEPEMAPTFDEWLHSGYAVWISIAVFVVIFFGSLRSFIQLSGGGKAVAKMVGARRIKMSTIDPNERRLVNVVEEMSIASGTPVPVLYVMDQESAINAFVAGYRVNQAVLVVTKGTLENLSRDELQGVVGHEYSHVLNGDMRLNVRLIAVLAGILALGQLGGFMLRSMRWSGSGRSSSSSKSNNGGGIVIVIAIILFVVGYVGLFFGRLIKAAVSRQREYLADASSVQFTRNPDGIAGALWKIGRGDSNLRNSHAEDMSHMCFATSLKFSSLLATHPPLAKRIEKIDPYFNAKRSAERLSGHTKADAESAATAPAQGMGFAGAASQTYIETTPEKVTASVGNPTDAHHDFAERLHAVIPASVLDAAHADEECRAVVYALILSHTQADMHDVTVAMIKAHEDAALTTVAVELLPGIKVLGAAGRLPVLDIALPALKSMSDEKRNRFVRTVEALVKADKRLTLFEFVMLIVLRAHLSDKAGRADVVKFHKSDQVINEIRVLLSVLAMAGRTRDEDGTEAFARVMSYFTKVRFEMVSRKELKPDRLAEVFDKLAALSPLVKQSVITACADCVLHDGKVLPSEAELLRATALSLDCPMPPLLSN